MSAPQIPGFYYDPEKKKYFKILPNHHAPADAKYSVQNLAKEEKQRKRRKHDAEVSARQKRQLVQRSKICSLNSPSALAVERELGYLPNRQAVRGLVARSFSKNLGAKTLFDLNFRSGEDLEVLEFDHDSLTGAVLVGCRNSPHRSSLRAVQPSYNSVNVPMNSRLPQVDTVTSNVIIPFHSDVSSVNLCSTSRTLVTTTIGSFAPPSIHICSLPTQTPFGISDEDPSSIPSLALAQTINTSSIFTVNNATTIWTAALSPPPSSFMCENEFASNNPPATIAIGTASGLVSLFYDSGGYTSGQSVYFQEHSISSIAWLSPSLLALGTKSGTVPFWDSRSQGSSILVKHAASVTSVRATNDPTRIVVAGLQDTMALYDIRMIRPLGEDKRPSMSSKHRKIGSKISTSCPLLKFDHTNLDIYPLGMDVHNQLGLVAAADSQASVNIYSLINGEKVRSFPVTGIAGAPTPQIRCVRFVDDGTHGSSILASFGSTVRKFVC